MYIKLHHKRTPTGTVFKGIEVKVPPQNERRHIKSAYLNEMIKKGAAALSGDTIKFKGITPEHDLNFKVETRPGCFCCHCGEEIPYEFELPNGHSDKGFIVRKHVAEQHVGEDSPDSKYPAGYKVQKFYDCVLEK